VLLEDTFTHSSFYSTVSEGITFHGGVSRVLKQKSFSGEDVRFLVFDVKLLTSLADARPVLGDRTDDTYRDRMETKKAWRKVFVFKKTLKL